MQGGTGANEDIFSTPSKIIRDPNLLSSTFVPDNLVHRDMEIKDLMMHLRPAAQGTTPGNLIMTGPSGSGKTAVTSQVVEKLKNHISQPKDAEKLLIASVVAHASPYRVLKDLAHECGSELPKKGLSFEDGWAVLEKDLEGKRAVFILDEIDKYIERDPEAKVLYRLTRRPDTCLILISNLQPSPLLDMIEEPRVRSRLEAATRFGFLPYNALQLVDIIRGRLKMGALQHGAVGDGVVELCAALAQGKQGNAAFALNLFETAAKIAENSNAEKIGMGHVKIADRMVEESNVREAIFSMPPEKRFLLMVLLRDGPTAPSELYEKAGKISRELIRTGYPFSITDRRRADFLRELKAEGFVANNREGRTKGRGGVRWKASIPTCYDRATLQAYIHEAFQKQFGDDKESKESKQLDHSMYG